MSPMSLYDGFEESGFLGEGIAGGVAGIRAENATWFKLAEDTNATLMRATIAGARMVRTTNWSREAVAIRIAIRNCGTLQGVILMTERGMVTEGRMLARSLIENSFCMTALVDNAAVFLDMVRADSEASRRQQGKLIVDQKLGDSDVDRQKLQVAIDAIDKKAAIMSPKRVAALGPLLIQYLSYQGLSDDAGHVSASSLHRHVLPHPDGSGWDYRWLAGDQGENATTLHRTLLATLPIGIALTQILNDPAGNVAFQALAERFRVMPPVPSL